MDDLVLNVRQIAQYPIEPWSADDQLILQRGLGGAYITTTPTNLVTPFIVPLQEELNDLTAAMVAADQALGQQITELDNNLSLKITTLADKTADQLEAIREDSVFSFNDRRGNVRLWFADVQPFIAPLAPLNSPRFEGIPTAPFITDPKQDDWQIANTNFVLRAINDQLNDLLIGMPFVHCWNGRSGNVNLELRDVTKVFYQGPGSPTSPTPPSHSDSDRIATTRFVKRQLFDLELTLTTDIMNHVSEVYAPLISPHFKGIPTGPQPDPSDNSDQFATTEWVRNFVAHIAAGVLSFNGRTGFVDLELADITSIGGAPINNAHLTGMPTAPTPPFTDDSTRLATTAFVRHLVDNSVTSFNGRHGDITLTLNDILGAGGQPITHVANTAPASPVVGELWFDDTADRMKMWDGSHWVLTSIGSAQISTAEPADPHQGDLWWDPVSGELFVWYVDPTSSQWVIANTGVGTKGDPGPVGPMGPHGPPGPTGPQGEGIHLKGVVDTVGDLPATGNTPGDMWVTSDGTGYVWSGTHWVNSGVMRGPAGPQGPIGPEGPQGTGLTVKGTVPTQGDLPTTGNTPGDMWISDDTGTGWVWDGTQWVDAGPIQGPQGPPGTPGAPGAPGATGPQGPAGGTVTVSPTAPPTPNSGDLWFDSTNDILMIWDGSQWAIAGGGAIGGATVGAVAPTSPSTGDLWFDTAGNILKIYNGTTWVDAAAGGGLSDAPTTAGPYARQGGAWVQIIDDGVF